MKIRDISIRNKLLFTNMLMVLIPVGVMAVIIGILMPAIVFFANGMNPNARLTDSLGFLSVYQLQRNISNLEKQLTVQFAVSNLEQEEESDSKEPLTAPASNHEEVLLTPQILAACKNIDREGAMLAVFLDDNLIYLTEEASLERIARVFEDVNLNPDFYKDTMINASASGTVLINVSALDEEQVLRIVVADPTMTGIVVGGGNTTAYSLIRSGDTLMLTLLIIAIVTVLVTNGLLALFLGKGILEPLSKLRKATNEIRDGNLDCELDYSAKNEFGQVCADFDEMRTRLKTSLETQRRYEINRVEMIAGISHDLATPLTTIKGYASGLLDGIADTPEKRTHYIKTIYSTAEDMDRLVGDLSVSAKLDVEELPFSLELLNVTEFFKQVRDELLPSFTQNKMTLELTSRCDADCGIVADKVHFRRAVQNIMENCIKYRDVNNAEAGVVISLSDVGKHTLRVEIADNSTGVAPEDLEKIFFSFYRGDKARSGGGSGSGLGLAIAHKILLRHRGRIWAENNAQGGLSVIMELPIAGPKEGTPNGEQENTDC